MSIQHQIKEIKIEEQNYYTNYISTYVLRSGISGDAFKLWSAMWIEYRLARDNHKYQGELVFVMKKSLNQFAEELTQDGKKPWSASTVKRLAKELQDKGLLHKVQNKNESSWWVPVDPSDKSYYSNTIAALRSVHSKKVQMKAKWEAKVKELGEEGAKAANAKVAAEIKKDKAAKNAPVETKAQEPKPAPVKATNTAQTEQVKTWTYEELPEEVTTTDGVMSKDEVLACKMADLFKLLPEATLRGAFLAVWLKKSE